MFMIVTKNSFSHHSIGNWTSFKLMYILYFNNKLKILKTLFNFFLLSIDVRTITALVEKITLNEPFVFHIVGHLGLRRNLLVINDLFSTYKNTKMCVCLRVCLCVCVCVSLCVCPFVRIFSAIWNPIRIFFGTNLLFSPDKVLKKLTEDDLSFRLKE